MENHSILLCLFFLQLDLNIYQCMAFKSLSLRTRTRIGLDSIDLPSGYDRITFALWDGNWAENINLPAHPLNANEVIIRSSAGNASHINTTEVDIPINSLIIQIGSNYTFLYQKIRRKWQISGSGVGRITTNTAGGSIPENFNNFTFYTMTKKSWVSEVNLPPRANDGSYVIVGSYTEQTSKVSNDNMQYASTTTIIKDDEYVFKYVSRSKKWVIQSAPIRTLIANSVHFQIPTPTSQSTWVHVSDESLIEDIKLPEKAGDRDQMTIKSSATGATTIDPSNTDLYLALPLSADRQYDFLYIAEKGKWQLQYKTSNKSLSTTVNELGSGDLPSGYDLITFELRDGNFAPDVTLPAEPRDKDLVIVRSVAMYTAQLNTTDVDVPVLSMPIETGDMFLFEYDQKICKWKITGSYVTLSSDSIPEVTNKLSFYLITDENWVSEIKLPTQAKDGSYVIVRSNAERTSKVSNDFMQYASTTTINKDDEYIFKYLSGNKTWVIESAPIRTLLANSVHFQIPTPTSQSTRVLVSNESLIEDIKLPEKAGDRDQMTIKSSATGATTIDPSNTDLYLALPLSADRQYDFLYIAEKGKWQLQYKTSNKSLSTTVNELGSGDLPSGYDLITFELRDGNFAPDVTLPAEPRDKDLVIVRSVAMYTAQLNTTDVDVPVLSMPIETGDMFLFEYDQKICKWKITGSYVTLSSDSIPEVTNKLSFYLITDENWVSEIKLPTQAKDGSYVIVRSNAERTSKVSNDFMQYASTTTINKDDEYIFKYLSGNKTWVIESAPIRTLLANSVHFQIPTPTSQSTRVLVSNESLIEDIKLPEKAGDRDQMTIKSSATGVTTIDPSNTDLYLALPLRADRQYDFLYIAEKGKWQLQYKTSNKSLSTTVNELGSGDLPSGYDFITFELRDGNFAPDVTLPAEPRDKDLVIIRSFAILPAHLNTTDVDVPVVSMPIEADDIFLFEYDQNMCKWKISGISVTLSGDSIPIVTKTLSFYLITDENWISELKLPTQANDGSYIIVRSTANTTAIISKTNMLFASTTNIIKNDQYVFKFLSEFNSWVIHSAPHRHINVDSLYFQIPHVTSQYSIVSLSDVNWTLRIKLPEKAGNRDKLCIRSTATLPSIIDPSNVNMPGVMQLHAGEQYDFFYIAENKKWQLMKHPDTVYKAEDIFDGKIPNLTRPRTIINVSGNHYRELELPPIQQAGSRVIFKSSVEFNFTVLADEKRFTVFDGEIVAFSVNENGSWSRETVTIDLLLLYSDKAAARLGENVMRGRLTEAFVMTNEALENSGANFRYRMSGLRQIVAKQSWRKLGDPLGELREDPIVQGWRQRLRADGIYYEGTEEGCGLGYIRSNDFHMVATGSIHCTPAVMRHELGHNMGLHDAGESSTYNQGYTLLKTIMGGNDIPYYSTPHRYTQDYGIPMGIPNEIDAVRAMNERSAMVANFR